MKARGPFPFVPVGLHMHMIKNTVSPRALRTDRCLSLVADAIVRAGQGSALCLCEETASEAGS